MIEALDQERKETLQNFDLVVTLHLIHTLSRISMQLDANLPSDKALIHQIVDKLIEVLHDNKRGPRLSSMNPIPHDRMGREKNRYPLTNEN